MSYERNQTILHTESRWNNWAISLWKYLDIYLFLMIVRKGLKLLPEAMKEQGVLEHNQFALCFGKSGGRMFLGGYNHSLNIGNHDEMPIGMRAENYYYINLHDIMVNIYIYIYI